MTEEEKLKFNITFKRTLQVMPYESVTIGYTREWHVGEVDDDTAFQYCWKKVEEWAKSFMERPEIKLEDARKRRGIK